MARAVFVPPEHWSDADWLASRKALFEALSGQNDDATVDLTKTNWIDPEPLLALLLLLSVRSNTARTRVVLPENGRALRALRYLIDAGFFEALHRHDETCAISVSRAMQEYDIKHWLENQAVLLDGLPLPTLAHRTVLRCRVIELTRRKSRDAVIELCSQELRDASLSAGAARALNIYPNLIDQLKVFYSSVLPELIDNTRLHKRRGVDPSVTALYVRIRYREDHSYARQEASAKTPSPTLFRSRTEHLWNHDVIDAVVADLGHGIQDSLMDAWKRSGGKPSVPRVLIGNRPVRVDGRNGDQWILQSCFESSLTRLSNDERRSENLPNLTGLHAVRLAIAELPWHVQVTSGRSVIYLGPASSDPDRSQLKYDRSLEIVPGMAGVSYAFRFTSTEGRPGTGWFDARPKTHKELFERWSVAMPPLEAKRLAVDLETYTPPDAEDGSIVVCRANHGPGKPELLKLLRRAHERQWRLVFLEQTHPTAVAVKSLAAALIRREQLRVTALIATNSCWTSLVGVREDAVLRMLKSFGLGILCGDREAWWERPDPGIATIVDLSRWARAVDSFRFWEMVREDGIAYCREDVEWGQDLVLTAGYLVYPGVIANRELRKLMRKRGVVAAHMVRAERVEASLDYLRGLAGEINRNLAPPTYGGRTSAVCWVDVRGDTASLASRRIADKAGVPVTMFQYPRGSVVAAGGEAAPPPRSSRAFDWIPDEMWRKERPGGDAALVRVGRADEVTREDQVATRAAPEEPTPSAIGTWQRRQLIRFGHFSTGRHHQLLWIDLLSFINDRSAEAQAVLLALARRVETNGIDVCIIALGEVSSEVAEGLERTLEIELKDTNTPRPQIWRVHVSGTGVHYGALSLAQALRDRFAIPPRVLVVDDVAVTGNTLLDICAAVRRAGATVIHSAAILDRLPVASSIRASCGAYAPIWMLPIPPAGGERGCAVCRGLQLLEVLRGEARSGFVRAEVESWLGEWRRRDILDRYRGTVRDRRLSAGETLVVGDQPVAVGSELGKALCVLYAMSESSGFSILERMESEAYSEVGVYVAGGGLLLLSDRMPQAARRCCIRLLVRAIGEDTRPATRGLIAIALSSVGHGGAAMLKLELETFLGAEPALSYSAAVLAVISERICAALEEGGAESVRTGIKTRRPAAWRHVVRLESSGLLPRRFLGLAALGMPTKPGSHYVLQRVIFDLLTSPEATQYARAWDALAFQLDAVSGLFGDIDIKERYPEEARVLAEYGEAFRPLYAAARSGALEGDVDHAQAYLHGLQAIIGAEVAGFKGGLSRLAETLLVHSTETVINEAVDVVSGMAVHGVPREALRCLGLNDEEKQSALRLVCREDVLRFVLVSFLTDARHAVAGILSESPKVRMVVAVSSEAGVVIIQLRNKSNPETVERARVSDKFPVLRGLAAGEGIELTQECREDNVVREIRCPGLGWGEEGQA